MLKRAFNILASVALAVGLLYGIVHLCVLRFSAGDIYPPLSSLRADPLGLKAFHDALREAGFATERNHRALYHLNAGQHEPFTLFYAGASLERNIDIDEWSDLLQAAAEGNRVVLAFAPLTSAGTDSKPKPSLASTPKPEPPKKPSDQSVRSDRSVGSDPKPSPAKPRRRKVCKSDLEEPSHRQSLPVSETLARLGITLHRERAWERVELKARVADLTTEPVLSWHSVAWFELTGTRQLTAYRCAKKPVVIECPVGRGTVVLATDSFFISNEAMRDERAPRLLTWLVGGNRRVVFDESHHGVSESTGVAGLLRAYHLEGVFGVLALLAVLYVWKNASPLLPRVRTEGESSHGDVVTGRNASEGFVNLLRRSIPHSRLVAVCVEEWNRAFAHKAGPIGAPTPGESPERQYMAIAQIAAKKRRPGNS